MTSNISNASNITAYFNGQEIGRLDSAEISTTIPNSNMQSSNLYFNQDRISVNGTLNFEPITATIATSPRIRSRDTDLYDYLEDYIKNRNQENVLFINHNTSQREIEYNSIDDIIAFRARLDEIIKEYYQR